MTTPAPSGWLRLRPFVAAFCAAAAIRFAIAIYTWDLLRPDDLYPMTQPRPWEALSAVWMGFGRVLPGGIFALLDKVAPDLPIDFPLFRIVALSCLCAALAVAACSWRLSVHWGWKAAAAAIAALHPFWIDIAQFRCNDVATTAGMLGCIAAIVAMAGDGFDWRRAALLFLGTAIIAASYQPFVYFPLLWALLDVAMDPARFAAGMRRFAIQVAVVLATLAVYFVAMRLAHIEARTALVGSLGEVIDHGSLVLLLALKSLVLSEDISGPVPPVLGGALLVVWLVALGGALRRTGGMTPKRLVLFLAFLLCLFPLLSTPLHALLAEKNYPPRLYTQFSLLFAAMTVWFGATRHGRGLVLPVGIVAVLAAGFALADLRNADVQWAIWQRDIDIADYIEAEIGRQPAIVQPRNVEVQGRLDRDWAYRSLGLEGQLFSIFFSNFSNNSPVTAVVTLPYLAWHGGYRLPRIPDFVPPQRADPVDKAACAAAFAAPPPTPGGAVTEAQVERFSGQVRVLERQGAPLLCLGADFFSKPR